MVALRAGAEGAAAGELEVSVEQGFVPPQQFIGFHGNFAI